MELLMFSTLSGCCRLLFVFFKQKTAYVMRISDLSSGVCSSDLTGADQEIALAALVDRAADLGFQFRDVAGEILGQRGGDQLGEAGALAEPEEQIAADPVGVAG